MDNIGKEKVLIVYYSRTGTIRTVAKGLQEKLGCKADNATYANESGPGIFQAIIEAFSKKTRDIKGDLSDVKEYSRVIVLSPVWAGGLSTPIRSYLKKHGGDIASYSLISVMSGSGSPEKDATAAAGKPPVKTALLLTRQVKSGEIDYDSLLALAQ